MRTKNNYNYNKFTKLKKYVIPCIAELIIQYESFAGILFHNELNKFNAIKSTEVIENKMFILYTEKYENFVEVYDFGISKKYILKKLDILEHFKNKFSMTSITGTFMTLLNGNIIINISLRINFRQILCLIVTLNFNEFEEFELNHITNLIMYPENTFAYISEFDASVFTEQIKIECASEKHKYIFIDFRHGNNYAYITSDNKFLIFYVNENIHFIDPNTLKILNIINSQFNGEIKQIDHLGYPRLATDPLGYPRLATDPLGYPRLATDINYEISFFNQHMLVLNQNDIFVYKFNGENYIYKKNINPFLLNNNKQSKIIIRNQNYAINIYYSNKYLLIINNCHMFVYILINNEYEYIKYKYLGIHRNDKISKILFISPTKFVFKRKNVLNIYNIVSDCTKLFIKENIKYICVTDDLNPKIIVEINSEVRIYTYNSPAKSCKNKKYISIKCCEIQTIKLLNNEKLLIHDCKNVKLVNVKTGKIIATIPMQSKNYIKFMELSNNMILSMHFNSKNNDFQIWM
jgi:hypothetical protein